MPSKSFLEKKKKRVAATRDQNATLLALLKCLEALELVCCQLVSPTTGNWQLAAIYITRPVPKAATAAVETISGATRRRKNKTKPSACQHVIHQGNSVQHVRQQLPHGCNYRLSVLHNARNKHWEQQAREVDRESERERARERPPGRSKSIWRFSTRTCPIHELTRPPTNCPGPDCNCNCNWKCPTGIGLRLRLSWHLTLIGHNLNSARERHELYLTFLALPKLVSWR